MSVDQVPSLPEIMRRALEGSYPGEFYVLDADHKPVKTSLQTWAKTFEQGSRRVAQDTIENVLVSTVFLGIDHRFSCSDGPPILFETMAFGLKDLEPCARCCTWDEALAQHAEMVRIVTAELAKPPEAT